MLFTSSHEWIRVEGEVGVVGITHYAQKELGEIVFVELPKVGQEVKVGEPVCVLESTKAAADVYAPVSGKIIAINSSVKTEPGQINRSAEKEGWLFQIALSQSIELPRLLSPTQYKDLVT